MSEERSKRTMETSGGKKITVEIKRFENEKASLFDLGHPLLNSIADSFVKAAGVGALQAVSREAYFTVADGAGSDSSENNGSKQHRFPNLRGESSKSLEALVKNTGKESLQWGLAAGLYSGITYGMKEARGGSHDWRNSVVAGALTGAAMAMTTSERTSHDQVVQSALTGAAISAAANLLSSIF
ncbi:outer envelope pore protein 16-2, chloroplastic [Brassica rapa]|nr:outer envelope pore protein 16-2, chloroplastic [Brassica rapa]